MANSPERPGEAGGGHPSNSFELGHFIHCPVHVPSNNGERGRVACVQLERLSLASPS